MYAVKVGRAIDSGVKGGDDYGGPRLLGGPSDFNQLNGASVKYAWDSWLTARLVIAAHCHKCLSFARVLKSCQFKHSSNFKAFKHKKMQNNLIQYSQARFCAYNAQAQN